MTDLQGRVLIGALVIITLTIRLVCDYFYPYRVKRHNVPRCRRVSLVKNSCVALFGCFLTAQIICLDVVPMQADEWIASMARILAVLFGVTASIAMTWPRIMVARLHAWAGPITSPDELDEQGLVTWGPYRYVRHPFYAGMIIGVTAIELVVLSKLVFVLVPLMILAEILIANREERQLEAVYGAAYREYQFRTARFFPGLY